MSNTLQKNSRLEMKLIGNTKLTLIWLIFLLLFVKYVSWPLRDIALVCWVYGWKGYSIEGIRVLSAKPVKFSNDVLAPKLADFVTGFGCFFVIVLGLTFLLIFILRIWEKHSLGREKLD